MQDMNAIDEAILILDEAAEAIRGRLAAEGINATGRSAAAFFAERTGKGCRLVYRGDDVAPLLSLEEGQPPGEMPSPDVLFQWSRDKGLAFRDDADRYRFAWLAAEKIFREGTGRHKSPVDVFASVCREAAEEIKSKVKDAIIQEFKRQ
jgi:hypothetical protein